MSLHRADLSGALSSIQRPCLFPGRLALVAPPLVRTVQVKEFAINGVLLGHHNIFPFSRYPAVIFHGVVTESKAGASIAIDAGRRSPKGVNVSSPGHGID